MTKLSTRQESIGQKAKHILLNYPVLLILFAFISILAFCIIHFHNLPQLDDFDNAYVIRERGLLGYFTHFFQEWTGRYTSLMLLGIINPLNWWSFKAYGLVTLTLFLLFLFSIYFFIKSFLPDKKNRIPAFSLMLLFFLIISYRLPGITSAYYWLSSVVIYNLGNAFLLFSLAFIVRDSIKKSLFNVLMAIIFISLACGTNEVTALHLVQITVFAVFMLLIYKSSYWKRMLPFMFIAIISTLVSFLAPGNFARADVVENLNPHYHDILWSLNKGAYFTGLDIWKNLKNIPLFALSIIFFYQARVYLRKESVLKKIFSIHPLWAIAFYLFSILTTYTFLYYIGGYSPLERTTNIIYFFNILGWFYVLGCLAFFADKKYGIESKLPLLVAKALVMISLFFLFSGKSNHKLVIKDLVSGRTAAYNKELRARYYKMEWTGKEKPGSEFKAQKLSVYPESIFYGDLMKETDAYMNRSQARYFGLKKISME